MNRVREQSAGLMLFCYAGRKNCLERYERESHIVREQRIRLGYTLPPDVLADHEKWMAEHHMN